MSTAASIHQQVASLWNQRDFAGLRNLMDPEYSFTGADGKEMTGGPDVGVGIAQMFASAFPDGTLEVKKVYTQGDTAIAEMVGKGTHQGELMGIAPTGKWVEIPICNVMELSNGKVRREREYMDMLNMMSQMGVVKAPGAVGA
jgi:ketosteroid isomerase-like protein